MTVHPSPQTQGRPLLSARASGDGSPAPAAHPLPAGLQATAPRATTPQDAQQGEAPRLPWWSLTKTALAATCLRLAAAGRLALDAPLPGRPFNLRQLLRHSAGLRNYGGPDYLAAVAAGQAPWPAEDLLRRAGAHQLMFQPDQGWAYSNIGYLLVRQCLEQQCNRPLDEVLHQWLLQPAGLQDTRIALGPEDLKTCLWGQERGQDKDLAQGYHPGWVYHGLLIGPPTDAVRLLQALSGGDLLDARQRAQWLEAVAVGGALPGRPWQRTDYALGLMTGTWDGVGRVWGHSGVGPDSVAACYHFPDLPDAPTVACFSTGSDEAVVEWAARDLALSGKRSSPDPGR